MLTQIAVLVDKYELLEMTHFSAGRWLSGIKQTIPTELNYDLLAGILITEVFKEKAIFQQVQKVAVFEKRGLMNASGLPIAGQILGVSFSNSQTMYY